MEYIAVADATVMYSICAETFAGRNLCFGQIRKSLCREKFWTSWFAKVYVRKSDALPKLAKKKHFLKLENGKKRWLSKLSFGDSWKFMLAKIF